jgi:hypothetical protein
VEKKLEILIAPSTAFSTFCVCGHSLVHLIGVMKGIRVRQNWSGFRAGTNVMYSGFIENNHNAENLLKSG